jgi:hypothetical protein
LNKHRPSQDPQGRIELPNHRDPQRRHRHPSNFSLLPLPSSCPGLKQFFRSNKAKKSKSRPQFSFPPIVFPPPYKRKRKQRRMEHYFSRIHPPMNPQIPQQQSAINSIPNKYVNRSFGSCDSLDPSD